MLLILAHTYFRGLKMKKKNKKTSTPLDSAWGLFEKTGNISYYLLYKHLNEKD